MNCVQSVIVMSDVHLGIPESYLHCRNESYAANCKVFLKLLKKSGPRDELILNGDFLDLVLGGHDNIYIDAREFFKLLSQAGPYKRIVYIPGNHDHHCLRHDR